MANSQKIHFMSLKFIFFQKVSMRSLGFLACHFVDESSEEMGNKIHLFQLRRKAISVWKYRIHFMKYNWVLSKKNNGLC